MPTRPQRSIRSALAAILAAVAAAAGGGEQVAGPGWWPQFRGPGAVGVADAHPLPTEWDAPTGRNVAWKTAIPGLAHSSPVVWGDRLFVTTAISEQDRAGIRTGLYGDITPVDDASPHRFEVWCLDRNTGEVIWRRVASEGPPRFKRHPKSTHANPSPATDGRHLAVSFGSEGLYVYDLGGKLLWQKDLGPLDAGYYLVPTAQWGYAASPVIHDGRLVVQADVQKDSFLAAFDVASGEELWRTPRADVPTWSTPTVDAGSGRPQVIVNGFRQIGGFDLETGALLWQMPGGGDIPIPTPYVVDGRIYLTSAHGPGSPIYAIRADAEGTLGRDHPAIVWSRPRGGSYMPTTVVYRGLLYVCRDNGALSVYDAATGERLYERRIGSGGAGFVASAVAGDGKVYFTDEGGTTYVLAAGSEYRRLARNELDEVVLASPAIADGTLYFRTRGHVVAVQAAAPEPTSPAAP